MSCVLGDFDEDDDGGRRRWMMMLDDDTSYTNSNDSRDDSSDDDSSDDDDGKVEHSHSKKSRSSTGEVGGLLSNCRCPSADDSMLLDHFGRA